MNSLAVIFDMDGVLIDSVSLNWEAYNRVLARHHCHVYDDEIYKYIGMTLSDQVSLLNVTFGLDIDAKSFEKESSKIKKRLFKAIQPKDGAVALLNSLAEADIPRAVGTSSPLSITWERLTSAGIWDLFDAHITADDVSAHKPNPEVYIRATTELNVAPTYCVVIEDSPTGIEAAKRAGMRCIAIKTPYTRTSMLDGADVVAASLDDISTVMLRKLVAQA